MLFRLMLLFLLGGWSELCFGAYLCNDSATCLIVHMNNPMVRKVLDQRCTIDHSGHTHLSHPVGFTHVPKCGGSAVHTVLQNALGPRYFEGPAHEPFPSSLDRSHDKLIYVTILREPFSRLISDYQYMRDKLGPRRILPPLVRKEFLWSIAQRTQNILQWLNNTRVRTMLSHQLPDYFVSSYAHSISTRQHFVLKTNRTHYTPLIPFDAHLFLQYLHNVPEEYQCVNHLKIVIVLLQRYAVVGVLEQMHDFWEIAFRRLKLDQSLFEEATARHTNKSQFSISDETKEKVRQFMRPYLYCQSVVWSIAKMISDQDKQCVASVNVTR